MPGPLIQPASLPWWADPDQSSVFDSTPVKAARTVSSLLGLNDPNQIMSMGTPLSMVEDAPGGLVKFLMNYKKAPLAEPTGKLLELLHGFNADPVDPATAVSQSRFGGPVPPPTLFNQLYHRAVSRIPEAEGQFEIPSNHKQLTRPSGMYAQYARESAVRKPFKEAAKALKYAKPDLPTVSDPNELDSIVTTGPANISTPKLSGTWGQGGDVLMRLAKSGLTVDMIRDIRTLGAQAALKKYPHMKADTIRGIVRGDSWSRIK